MKILLTAFCCFQAFAGQAQPGIPAISNIVLGADQLQTYLPMLEGKQVGLVVNHTSRVGQRHLVDTLHNLGVCVARIFAPEHGFRGEEDAGELIADGMDRRTEAMIVSLYGKKKKPSPDDLSGLDVLVFDMQDVGARFYTYISTLYYLLEACAENGKQVLVLDRPNPNGHLVDGPVLDMRFSSFVGIAPLPVAHGCTVGELARLFKGENWINKGYLLDLQVIPCLNYTHDTPYEIPVKPSPNLPTTRAVLLYPSLCLFEGTTSSVGRGTNWPFEVIGHPAFSNDAFSFIPQANKGNKSPLHELYVCRGLDFRTVSPDSLRLSREINIKWLLDYYAAFPDKSIFFREDKYMDLLAGTDQFRLQIIAQKSEAAIRATWAADLACYKEIRKDYLLYP